MINRFLYSLLLCTAVVSSHIAAQVISGRITNSNGDPLPSEVAVLNSEQQQNTDEKGRFSFQLADNSAVKLLVSSINYADKIVTLTPSDTEYEIILDLAVQSIDAVVVTAERQEGELVQTPIAVSVLDERTITASRTWDLRDLNGLVPNYLNSELGVGWQAIQSIRGIQVFSENPAIATYVDGINQLDILANGFPLTDIERIEVLRGPQGTLFGRNAMGGVVNVITKKPGNTRRSFLEAGIGNYGLQRYAAGVSTPIVKDKLFLSINGLYQYRDGYFENDTSRAITPNNELEGVSVGEEATIYGNAKLHYLPTDRLAIKLDLKYQRDDSDASAFFLRQLFNDQTLANPEKVGLSSIGTHNRNVFTAGLNAKYYLPSASLALTTSFQQIGLNFNGIEFGSINYSSSDGRSVGDGNRPQRVFSQELKLTSQPNTGPWDYTAGLYFFAQDAFEPSTNLAFEASQLGPNTFGILINEGVNLGVAAFGQLTYSFDEFWSLTGGLRYDYETRENTFNGFGDLLIIDGVINELGQDTTISADFDALSPKLAVEYQPNDNSNLYLSYNRGFRAGGINASRVPTGVPVTFEPETSNNFELGYRFNSSDGRFYAGATLFWIEWQDLQFFDLFPQLAFARTNVGDARSRGLELEVKAILTKQLNLQAALGLNDTEYRTFELERFSGTSEIGGNLLSNAPRSTTFIALDYSPLITEDQQFTIRGEIRRIGEQFTDIQNQLKIDPYTLLNARIAYRYQRYELSLWARNLTNEVYFAYGSADTSFGLDLLTAQPRTFGANLSVQF